MVKIQRNRSHELHPYGIPDIGRGVRAFAKDLTMEGEWQCQATRWYRMQCFRNSFRPKQDLPVLFTEQSGVVHGKEWVKQRDRGPYSDTGHSMI